MSAEPLTLDRETAHRLNPLISAVWTEDTLNELAGTVQDIGFILSSNGPDADGGQGIPVGRMYLLLGAVAAALAYEADNIQSCADAKRLAACAEIFG